MENHCWRCSSAEELSINNTTKNGTKRYICKSCRRSLYYLNKGRNLEPSRYVSPLPDGWLERAHDNHLKIISKYS